jgi:hypothetical protein
MVNRRAFAATQWKLPVVGIAAAGCIGLMIYQLIPNRSERTDIQKPTVVRADGTTPEPRRRRQEQAPIVFEESEEDANRDYVFSNVSNTRDVTEQMSEMSQSISDSRGDDATDHTSLAGTVAAFLEPTNAADADGFDAAVSAMGGSTAPGDEGNSPTSTVFTIFSELLKHASLDPNQIDIRKPTFEAEGENISFAMNQNREEDPETGEEIETLSTTVSGAAGGMFPNASGENAVGELVELRLPFRSKNFKRDKPDVVLVLQMRDVPGAGWQPGAFQISIQNKELADALMQQLMSRRNGG